MSSSKKVLIFTGAGIGVPLGLPTSTGFIRQVRSGMKAVTAKTMEYLGGTSSEDIEWILATLEAFGMEVSLTEHLLPVLVEGNPQAVNGKDHIKKKITSFKEEARSEIKRIKRLIFEGLADYERTKASSLYYNLFSELKTYFGDASFTVMTTNYDLTFEAAIEEISAGWDKFKIKDFEYGFSNLFGRPVYDSTKNIEWLPEIVVFLKLHGSLDWHRDALGKCSRSMSSTVPNDPDQMAILYPGFKGVPETEPFSSLHGRFHRRLAEADIAIVIGFAFRDTYINSIFENVLRLRKDFKIYYFNPLTLEDHPSGSMAPRLAAQYSNFVHEKKGIELSDTPLNLSLILDKK